MSSSFTATSSNTTLLNFSVTQLTIASIVIYFAVYLFLYKANVPRDVPWVGAKTAGFFQEKKAAFAALSHITTWLGEGYHKYGKLGKSYILPAFDGHTEIVIPNNKLQWLLEHDDQSISVAAAHYEVLSGDYAWPDSHLLRHPYHEHVVHKNLARKIGGFIPKTWIELNHIVEKELGSDTEWKDITIMEPLQTIVSAISNSMFVGRPLCRNKEFLVLCSKFANDIGMFMGLWSFVPRILRPLFGPIISSPNNYHARKIRNFTMPLVQQRFADIAYNETHPDTAKELPDDYITWHINLAKAENNQVELDPEMVCKRLLPIEFAAMHTTTFTLVNLVLDLISSKPELNYLADLREEAERVYKECNGEFDKVAISKLVRADSAIRESMRLSTFMTTSVNRKVVAPEGLKSPTEGWTAPQGALISVDAWTRQHDAEIYPDPWSYDAFRFSRAVENSSSHLERARLSMVTTGESFLPFGHGKHACPGRFFVNQELKLILVYLLTHYDLAYIGDRPPNVKIGPAVIPPAAAKMRIRKRTDGIFA